MQIYNMNVAATRYRTAIKKRLSSMDKPTPKFARAAARALSLSPEILALRMDSLSKCANCEDSVRLGIEFRKGTVICAKCLEEARQTLKGDNNHVTEIAHGGAQRE